VSKGNNGRQFWSVKSLKIFLVSLCDKGDAFRIINILQAELNVNKSILLLLLFSFVFLVGCQNDEILEDTGSPEGSFNPMSCTNQAGANCGMKWVIQFPKENFPETIELLINGKRVFIECGDTHFHVNRTSTIDVEITMFDYVKLNSDGIPFSMQLKRVKNCYDLSRNENFKTADPQAYKISTINGEKIVLIRN
jgi:hypothetical protein